MRKASRDFPKEVRCARVRKKESLQPCCTQAPSQMLLQKYSRFNMPCLPCSVFSSFSHYKRLFQSDMCSPIAISNTPSAATKHFWVQFPMTEIFSYFSEEILRDTNWLGHQLFLFDNNDYKKIDVCHTTLNSWQNGHDEEATFKLRAFGKDVVVEVHLNK